MAAVPDRPAPRPLPFTIDTDMLGHGQVVVDGRDLAPDLRGVTVTIEPGQPTRLTLYADRPGTIKGEGIVEVQPLGGGNGDAVRALDPHEVRARVDAQYLSAADDMTAATLSVAAQMLDEANQ